ncbi:NAD(P)H-dependent oxidoreductase [Persicobacter psychrovividus]|uniref:NAD(P)H-dependent oxidoreductase n=2 Tax=Persicobacter psychrovividus TaxID=387638 RepID=A0ABM7VCQ6_9BACT|nr:NAD(P)H-dependent oxidoreductase [Persicobacter psychrovividus]
MLESLRWRYATKKFDASKKISGEDLEYLKESIRLSPSSYGLQLFKVLIIEDEDLRKKLRPAAWDQSQITDASHLFVFCNYIKVEDEHIDEYVQLKADALGIDFSELSGYGDFVKGVLKEKDPKEVTAWTARQPYIALGNLLTACATQKIDACPMEGFEPEKFSEILGLEAANLQPVVLATVGYRSAEDQTKDQPKVRKPADRIFESR